MKSMSIVMLPAALLAALFVAPCSSQEAVAGSMVINGPASRLNHSTEGLRANSAAIPRSQEAAAKRIVAEPVGDNMLNPSSYSEITPTLILNNDGDRIGARVELCQMLSDSPCDEMTFYFPQLRLDRAKKLVYLGDMPVATFRPWGLRIEPTKDYRLKYEITQEPFDSGFHRSQRYILQVILEQR